LIAGLCLTDKSFPMHLWDRLLPQTVIILNLLRTSRINTKPSAATHIFGKYDFNRAPMAPPGTRIIAHETPNLRSTWAPHGLDGWYLGPALEHYICYTVHITKTVKLLTLPHPPMRARMDARTNPSAQRATQLRSVLSRVYAVSIQNQITTTVP
jgi:hypothetical protein